MTASSSSTFIYPEVVARPMPVAELTDADFDSILAARLLALVDFWGPDCGPCVPLGKIVEELGRLHAPRLDVFKLNIDENPETVVRHGVMAAPTLILFSKGREVERLIGGQSRGAIEKVLAKHLR